MQIRIILISFLLIPNASAALKDKTESKKKKSSEHFLEQATNSNTLHANSDGNIQLEKSDKEKERRLLMLKAMRRNLTM